MNVVIVYDVNTETSAGRRRLRRIAKACEGFGQRVQLSVFECSLTPTELERFRTAAMSIIDPREDSLRIYRLHGPRNEVVEAFGRDVWVDMSGPMVL